MIRFFCPPSCRLLRKCPDPNVGLEDAPEPAVEHLSDANQSARGLRTIAGNRRERSLAAGNAAQFIPANDRTLPSPPPHPLVRCGCASRMEAAFTV